MPHIHDRIDFTVEVFIVHNNTVLLRMHEKYNKWLAAGGHIELHEDPVEAALREAQEETGLSIALIGKREMSNKLPEYSELLAPRFMNRHRISETHEHVTLIYFATAETADINPHEGEAKTECKWFKKEELADPEYNIPAHIQEYAHAALEAAQQRTF